MKISQKIKKNVWKKKIGTKKIGWKKNWPEKTGRNIGLHHLPHRTVCKKMKILGKIYF
jgi:hypothetical protein